MSIPGYVSAGKIKCRGRYHTSPVICLAYFWKRRDTRDNELRRQLEKATDTRPK